MPKKEQESFLEYRQRLMNPISPTFCAAKWLNATIWLESGMTSSCHHPPPHAIDPVEVETNFKAIHNTQTKKAARQEMLDGTQPKECDYCWRVENSGPDQVSDRIFKTVIYEDEEIQALTKSPSKSDVNLQTLEIAFDRVCNFACSYCHASFSTTWAKDIRDNGAYLGLKTEGGIYYTYAEPWGGSRPTFKPDENPYYKAFWQWWPELRQSLKELRITGGEPMMSPHVWKILDEFNEHQLKFRLAINSNLGGNDKMIDKLIEKSKGVHHFEMYTSCEALGPQAEYIRDGLKWETFKKNVERVCSEGNLHHLGMMMTINFLCLFSITDFMDQCLEWKAKFGSNKPVMTFNILRFPSFMSPLALPPELLIDRTEALKYWYEKNKSNPLLLDFEKAGIERLIHYLENVDAPHDNTSPREELWKDFKMFFGQYDRRRKKDITKAFPKELVDWLETI